MAAQAISAQFEDKEEWKDIPGWEGLYQASSHGRIRSLGRLHVQRIHDGSVHEFRYKGKLRKPHINKQTGYPMVGLSAGNAKRVTATVHSLVCEAFHGPKPEGCEVAHNDGNRLNSRVDNLRWATREENARDRVTHGTAMRGEKHGGARFSAADVNEMKSMRREGAMYKDIAAHFDAFDGYIRRVVIGARRKHG